jgi:hypothetical protein
VSYPHPLYDGEHGAATAWAKVATTEPDLVYPNGGTVRHLATDAEADGLFGLYERNMSSEAPELPTHFDGEERRSNTALRNGARAPGVIGNSCGFGTVASIGFAGMTETSPGSKHSLARRHGQLIRAPGLASCWQAVGVATRTRREANPCRTWPMDRYVGRRECRRAAGLARTLDPG